MSKDTRKEFAKSTAKLRIFRDLLLWEATGGIIELPKGAEGYKVPPIPFSERRAMLDSMNRDLLTSFKVDPKEEVSAFELLKGEGHAGSANKRQSYPDRGGSILPKDSGSRARGEPAVNDNPSADDSAESSEALA